MQNYKSLYLHLNDNPRFLLDYGVLLYNNKSYNESIYVLLQGDSISNNPAYLNVVGKNYESIACYSSAEYYYRKAFSRVPSRLYPLYSMAILYYKLNRYDDFVNLSDSILRFEPKVTSFVTNAMKKEISDILNALRKDGVCENK